MSRSTSPRQVRVDNDGVTMTVSREMRLRHVSDTARGDGVVFGGDSMGHWNVDRINRILDAMGAPTRQLSLPPAAMHGMAMVGAPDPVKVEAYVRMGVSQMPPLTFVSFDEPEKQAESTIRTMLVDGHHRMAALFVMGAASVPARVLPRELERDVRVVELSEVAIFPRAAGPQQRSRVGEMAGMSMDLTHAMAGSALRRATAIDDTVRVATAGLGDDARQIARLAATIAFDAGFAMRELLHADLVGEATAPSTLSPATEDEEP